MKQETNTAATTLEQVNAMPAATWGWLKMNQTKLELSDELATAPAEAVEVEGLDEQFAGSADAFDAAMEAMAERVPERRAAAPGDAADRARITPETELDVPATSVYQAGAIKLEEELSPAEAFETGMGEAAYTYLAEHATKRIVIDVPAYKHATVTVRVSGVDAAAAIAAIDVVARPQSTLDLQISINLIPHTVQNTALHALTAGAQVNLEIDLIARYVERMLSAPASQAPAAIK